MTRPFAMTAYDMTVEPLCKLAGVALLLGSFAFTTWILGHAAVAIDHVLDDVVSVLRVTIFDRYDSNLLNG